MNTQQLREFASLVDAARAMGDAEKAQALEGLYATGHWLLSQERFKDAADVLRLMCTVGSEDERGWVALGMAHEGAGHLTVAKEIYAVGRTLARRPGRCELALARVLKQLDDDDNASEAVERAAVIAEESDDEDLRALVAFERRTS